MKSTAGWILALIVVLVWSWWRQDVAEARGRREQARADSLAFEGVVQRASTEWQVRFADRTERLTDSLTAVKDDALARFAVDLLQARGRIRQLERVRISLEGQIASLADSVVPGDTLPARVSGPIDDGFLVGRWWVRPPDGWVGGVDYAARAVIELVTAEGADGRVAVGARAQDPRLSLEFDRLLFEPPAPVVIRSSSFRGLLLAFLGGATTCALVC